MPCLTAQLVEKTYRSVIPLIILYNLTAREEHDAPFTVLVDGIISAHGGILDIAASHQL